MRTLSTRIDLRHLIGAVLAAVAIFAAVAAIPSGASDSGALAKIAPQPAQAFEGGFDGAHAWVKISAGDIAGGIAEAACNSVAGPFRGVCPTVAARARDMIGSSNGVWAEIYIDHVNYGTW